MIAQTEETSVFGADPQPEKYSWTYLPNSSLCFDAASAHCQLHRVAAKEWVGTPERRRSDEMVDAIVTFVAPILSVARVRVRHAEMGGHHPYVSACIERPRQCPHLGGARAPVRARSAQNGF
jgi:hypothetical protein